MAGNRHFLGFRDDFLMVWLWCCAGAKAPESAKERLGLLRFFCDGGTLWDFWGTFGGTKVLFGAWGRQVWWVIDGEVSGYLCIQLRETG
jgi:hypothetical protein